MRNDWGSRFHALMTARMEASKRYVSSGGAHLFAEALGNPRDRCVILVMGAQASLLWWPTEFCEALVERKRYVLRFDHRDTGKSTKYPVGESNYSAGDFAADVIAVLDAFSVGRAQLVGVSMGGMIGQIVGIKYPERVSGLYILSATPLNAADDLPGPSRAFLDISERGEKINLDDRKQAVNYMLDFSRVLAALPEEFDEASARALVRRDFERSGGYAHGVNHFMAGGGKKWASQLPRLQVPLTVLHGRLDPLFPVEHGRALARTVPGARFVELPGGHGLGPSAWQPLLDEIARDPRTAG